MQHGFEVISKEFNGFPELLRRKDAGITLLRKYAAMDPISYYPISNDTLAVGRYIMNFSHIELLFSQEAILNHLTAAEMKALFRELLNKYQRKVENINVYGLYGLQLNALPLGRYMRLKRNENPAFETVTNMDGMELFLNKIMFCNATLLNAIIENAREFSAE